MKRVRKEDVEKLIKDIAEWQNIHLSEKYTDDDSKISSLVTSVSVITVMFIDSGSYSQVVFEAFEKEIEKATFGNLKFIYSTCEEKERYDIVLLYFANNYEVEN